MIYPIVVFGSPVLREKCREIGPDYPEVKKLIEDMFLTLEEAEGVGLAAPQIGKASVCSSWTARPGAKIIPNWPITGVRSSIPNLRSFRGDETLRRGMPFAAGIARERAAFARDPDALSGREFRAARRRVHRAACLGDPARI